MLIVKKMLPNYNYSSKKHLSVPFGWNEWGDALRKQPGVVVFSQSREQLVAVWLDRANHRPPPYIHKFEEVFVWMAFANFIRSATGWGSNQVYQCSKKTPPGAILVGMNGLEPSTPTLSGWCSNQLSYIPSVLCW